MTFVELNAALRRLTAGATHIDVEPEEGGAMVYAESADGLRFAFVAYPSDVHFARDEFIEALKRGRLPRPTLRRAA
jgi:hypothetical protein